MSVIGYVPTFGKHMFTLLVEKRHSSSFRNRAIGAAVCAQRWGIFPSRDTFDAARGFSLPLATEASATVVLGNACRMTCDASHFHCSYGHLREALSHDMARQMGVLLTGELQPCTGCSMGKGLQKAIPSTTAARATKRFERVFIDLGGQKDVGSVGGSNYCTIIRGGLRESQCRRRKLYRQNRGEG